MLRVRYDWRLLVVGLALLAGSVALPRVTRALWPDRAAAAMIVRYPLSRLLAGTASDPWGRRFYVGPDRRLWSHGSAPDGPPVPAEARMHDVSVRVLAFASDGLLGLALSLWWVGVAVRWRIDATRRREQVAVVAWALSLPALIVCMGANALRKSFDEFPLLALGDGLSTLPRPSLEFMVVSPFVGGVGGALVLLGLSVVALRAHVVRTQRQETSSPRAPHARDLSEAGGNLAATPGGEGH